MVELFLFTFICCAYLIDFRDNADLLIVVVWRNTTYEMAIGYFKESACIHLAKPRKWSEEQVSEITEVWLWLLSGYEMHLLCFQRWISLPLAASKPHDAMKASAGRTPKFNLLGELNFLSHTRTTSCRGCSLDNIGVIILWDSSRYQVPALIKLGGGKGRVEREVEK
jgi:hypothetical protein